MERLIVLDVVVQVSALPGALAWSWPTDRIGPKRVVMIAQWIAVVVVAYFVETQPQFYAVAIIAGTGLGAVQAASRTLLASLAPPGAEAQMFAFHALCSKSVETAVRAGGGGVASPAQEDPRLLRGLSCFVAGATPAGCCTRRGAEPAREGTRFGRSDASRAPHSAAFISSSRPPRSAGSTSRRREWRTLARWIRPRLTTSSVPPAPCASGSTSPAPCRST
jgi:MFS family permease